MGGQAAELAGPDLVAEGAEASEVQDGGTLLGHAGGEPVLLARRGGRVFAVGATCTHYGGPLAEGLVVGDTIRCPWHHACFSLKTGEVVAAPALSPIPCWAVEEREGRLFVGARVEPSSPTLVASPPAPASVVIVGAGAAGHAAAMRLRREGYAGSLTMIGADDVGPVDRPNLSKDYLAGTAPEEWLPLASEEVYARQGIDLMLGRTVTAIDPVSKRVTLDDGRTIEFGALLLATGAWPIRLPIPGAELQHVHVLRSLADCRAILAKVPEAARAVVIGASFIGLEVAASLRARGLAVRVVAPEAVPLEKVLGAEVGAFVRGLHEEKGVTFHLGRKPASIDAASVTLDDGSVIAADLVVMGVGVRPETRLAEAAGLKVDRGVIVSERLETSAPGVFAAGDVARYPDPRTGAYVRIEHWVVAQRMGETAALSLLGRDVAYRSVPFFWSQHYDVTIAYVGHAEAWDEAVIDGSLAERDATIRYRRGDRVLAVSTVFRDRESLEIEAAMEAELSR